MSSTTIVPKVVLALDAVMLLGLFSMWMDPESFCKQVFAPEELAAVPPRVLAALKSLFYVQIYTFGLGAYGTSLYLIARGIDPFVGHFIWVVINLGMMLSEFAYPFPQMDDGIQFLGFKGVTMDAAFVLRLTLALMNGAAMYFVKTDDASTKKQMKNK